MEVSLNPVSKEEIRNLESALLVMTLFSKETFEALSNPTERLTWIDSLYVAAAALARQRAGMSIEQIADELGVSDMSIRKHLKGETKAGKMVLEAFDRLSKEGLKIELPEIVQKSQEDIKLNIKNKIQEIEKILNDIKDLLK